MFVIILVYAVFSLANGASDALYLRFTSPKQTNLIIGTSRAAQGLQPQVFDSILKKPFYNYAFTIAHSPFGETYLKSIKKKLKGNTQNAIFIVTIDPWSLSDVKENPEDSLNFKEKKLSLGKTPYVNLKPNLFYLLNSYSGKYRKLLRSKKGKMFLHDDGWLEVSKTMDSVESAERIKAHLNYYKKTWLNDVKFSYARYNSLIKTIKYLNTLGKVYLVRMPVHNGMMKIEAEFLPDFDLKIKDAKNLSSAYLDFSKLNNDYVYNDGNHLYKDSGKVVSKCIANWILKVENNQ